MKQTVNQSTVSTDFRGTPIFTMSIVKPVPSEVAKRLGECMGLYDPPEQPEHILPTQACG